jgi:hypothetical protein
MPSVELDADRDGELRLSGDGGQGGGF